MLFTVRRIIALLRKPSKKGCKIFVIGINKTGTSSLGEALRILGYDHFSTFYNKWPQLHYIIWQRFKWEGFFVWLASKYDSFDDSPWYNPSLIRALDKKFPGSKFILLHRSKDEYVRSYRKYFALRPEVKVHDDPEVTWSEYIEHRNLVLNYFVGRNEDLLDISVKDPSGFELLASFLRKKAPTKHFPHKNRTPG